VSTTQDGTAITKLSLAVNRSKDQPPDYFEVVCWNKSWVSKAVKGSLVFVQGQMHSSTHKEKLYWKVHADTVLLGPKAVQRASGEQNDCELYIPPEE